MRTQIRKKCFNEKGTALLEFSLVLPIVLAALMGAYEFGVAAERYLALSRVVYEMGRFGAALPGLEEGTFSDSDAAAIPSTQNLMWLRANQMLDGYNFLGGTSIESEFVKSCPQGSLRLTLSHDHTPVFPILSVVGRSTIPMNVTIRAPYLVRDDC